MSSEKERLIKKKVASFRDAFNLNKSAAISLHSFLSRQGIISVFKPMSDAFSGMAIKTNEFKFILINSNLSIGRQNFTIGHELYHLYVQDEFETHSCNAGKFDKKNIEEYNADIFAANLLMPEDGIFDIIPNEEIKKDKISLNTLLKLESVFGVSHLAMLVRLKNMDLISDNFIENNRDFIHQKAKDFGFDTSIYQKGNENLILGDYKFLANELFEKEKISEGHFLELIEVIPQSNGEE